MGVGKRQQAIRAMRGEMASPGRPSAGWRADRVRFWEATAEGVSSEDAAGVAGVSPAVGARWFRQAGGMAPLSLAPTSSNASNAPPSGSAASPTAASAPCSTPESPTGRSSPASLPANFRSASNRRHGAFSGVARRKTASVTGCGESSSETGPKNLRAGSTASRSLRRPSVLRGLLPVR